MKKILNIIWELLQGLLFSLAVGIVVAIIVAWALSNAEPRQVDYLAPMIFYYFLPIQFIVIWGYIFYKIHWKGWLKDE